MMDQPVIILVRPQLGENIGMCARAMLNCGLTEMRLVAPRDGWPNPSAGPACAGADSVLENVRVYATVAEATADLHWTAATTARPRGMNKPIVTPEQAAGHAMTTIAQEGGRAGILFGAERTGLENEELAECQAIVNIPANPEFSSFNLAQAVLLLSYEWRKLTHELSIELRGADVNTAEWARAEEMNFFLNRLNELLVSNEFYRTIEMQTSVFQNIQTMFTRNRWTSQEIQTLHGIVGTLTGSRLK